MLSGTAIVDAREDDALDDGVTLSFGFLVEVPGDISITSLHGHTDVGEDAV